MIAVLDKAKNKYGVIDVFGNSVLPFIYDNILVGQNGIFSVNLDGIWGAIDLSRRVILDFRFESLGVFDEVNLSVFRENGFAGVIHVSGQVVIKPTFATIFDGFHGIYVAYNKGRHLLFNVSGSLNYEKQTRWLLFSGDLHRIGYFDTILKKYGYCSVFGGDEIAAIFDNIDSFSDGYAQVQIKEKRSFIDRAGKSVQTLQTDELRGFSEGLAAFKIEEKWVFYALQKLWLFNPSLATFKHSLWDCALFKSAKSGNLSIKMAAWHSNIVLRQHPCSIHAGLL